MMKVRQAIRGLLRSPAYALVTIATVCLAVGSNTAMFAVLHAVVLRALPYRDPGRLVEVGPMESRQTHENRQTRSVTYPEFERWRNSSRSFESLTVHFQTTGVSLVTLDWKGEFEAAMAGFVAASLFPTLGVPPALGRVFTPAEEQHQEPVAVLSDSLWRRRYGGSESAVGDTITVNGITCRIIGVMPATFAFPNRDSRLWLPLTLNSQWLRRAGPVPFFRVVGRLAPGVDPSRAAADLTGDDERARIGVVRFRPAVSDTMRMNLMLLSGAVLFILLIACVNIANLTLSRGSARRNEIALRIALGAGRARVAWEMFTESLILAAVGAAAGIGVASFGIEMLIRFGPPGLPRLSEAGIGTPVMLFSIGATLLAAILFGLLPAWQLSGRDPIDAIRGLGRSASSSASTVRLRGLLVSSEVALSVLLLAGAGLMIRSLLAVQRVDLGFDPSRVLTFRAIFPGGTPQERQLAYFRNCFERLTATPGVVSAGAIRDLFETNDPSALGLRQVEGRAPEPREAWTPLTWMTVAGSYFQSVGATLVRGRWFNDHDRADSPPVAVIDEAMARRYWPGEDPIGRRFKGQDPRGRNDDWVTVIGVVKSLRRQGLEREPTAHVFEWYLQSLNVPRDIVVRTAYEPAAMRANLRGVARSVDPTAIVSQPVELMEEIDSMMFGRRFQTTLMTLFAALAFVLAAVGIFGVLNYAVTVRMREFGIRAALGESAAMLRSRVLRDAMRVSLPGVAVGLAAALGLSTVLRSVVYGVSPVDPLSLGGAASLLLAVAALAGLGPARKAGSTDPAVALREE